MASISKHSALWPVLLLALAAPAVAEPARYASPQAAVDAMIAALAAGDRDGVLEVLGREYEDIYSTGVPEEDREIWGGFLRDYETIHRIETVDGRAILYTGRDFVAFPAEIVEGSGTWSFDSEGAREEIRMRRVGANELAVIDIMERASGIQATYRLSDHDGDGVREFAASILSSPGARDGLYWQNVPGTELSPLDENVARSSFDGYAVDGEDFDPEPYEGYYFRILQEQGPSAPGGAHSYLVNGNMLAGHAVLAVPAVYDETGISSFMVSESGVVYEADLGADTLQKAVAITVFEPSEGWAAIDLEHWR